MHAVQTTEPGGGLRAAKKVETRRRLVTAARHLALEHGLDGTTVEHVCADAGVSVRTFFNYFPSKEAAVLGDPPPVGTPSSRSAFLDGGPTGDLLSDVLALLDPSEALEQEGRAGLRVVLELAQREHRLLAAHLAHHSEQEQEIAVLVAERRGLPAPDTGCRAVAATAQALLHTAGRQWFEADDGSPLSEHLDRTRTALRDALA
jgi:AcrR family transcriptional regulator